MPSRSRPRVRPAPSSGRCLSLGIAMPVAAAVAVPVDPVGMSLPAGGDPVSRLEQLQSMLDKGLVTQAEYDAKRAEILAAM